MLKKLTLVGLLVLALGAIVAPAQAQTVKVMVVPEERELDPSWGFEPVDQTVAMNAKVPIYGISHAPKEVQSQFADAGEAPDGIGKTSSRTHIVRYNVLAKDGKPVAGWVSLYQVVMSSVYYINSVQTEGGIVSFSTDYDGNLIFDGTYYLSILPSDGKNYYTTTVSLVLGAVDKIERVRIPLKVASVAEIGRIVTAKVLVCFWEIGVLNSSRPFEILDLSLTWSGSAVRGDYDGAFIGNARVTIPQGKKLWVIGETLFPMGLAPGLYRNLSLRTRPKGQPEWVLNYSGCYGNKPAPQ